MDIVSWIVVGLIAGSFAVMVMHGSGYGLIGDIIIGLIGGIAGGFLASAVFGVQNKIGINVLGIEIVAFVDAMLLIWISRLLFHPRST